jgi:hypothetical protein
MNKRTYPLLLALAAIVLLVLTGCSGAEQATDSQSAAQSAGGNTATSLPMQLALGTLRLEGGDLAVTPEQAASLLPLWKAANTLSQADNVAGDELNAVFEQIQEAMTAEQMASIESMEISRDTMTQVAEELGLEMPNPMANLSEEQRAQMEAARASGQAPQSFGPGGGMGMGAEGGPPPEMGAGNSFSGNSDSSSQRRGGFGAVFYQAVIDLLEAKLR